MFVLLSKIVELNRVWSLILFNLYNQTSITTFSMRAANSPTFAVWNRVSNIYIHQNLSLTYTVYTSYFTNNILINWLTDSQSSLNFFEKQLLNCKKKNGLEIFQKIGIVKK